MMPRIAKATAGGVMTALADATFFAEGFAVDPDGYSLGWPSTPAAADEVGGIDFSAQGLWYRVHPEDLKHDHPAAAE